MENEQQKEDFFVKYQAETAGKAAIEVLKVLGNTDNLFILSEDPEEIKKYDEAYQEVLNKILEIFIRNKVGLTNYNYVWGSLTSIITGLKQHLGTHTDGLQKEISCRAVAVKNPKDGKYDVNYATHEDLINTVLKLRAEQGNVPGAEDYFTLVPKEEASVLSPIQPIVEN